MLWWKWSLMESRYLKIFENSACHEEFWFCIAIPLIRICHQVSPAKVIESLLPWAAFDEISVRARLEFSIMGSDPTAFLRPPGDIDNEDLMPRGLLKRNRQLRKSTSKTDVE